MIKLEGPIDLITGDECLEIFRDGLVEYVDAKPVKRNCHKFKVTCNVQPMGARDLLMVPEGDRYKEQYMVWSNNHAELVKDNDTVKRIGSQDFSEVKYYQIQSVENWGSYQKFRIMLIDVGGRSFD
jgi:hypothetical protein